MIEGITVVNFAHPITERQRIQIETLAGQRVAKMVDVATQADLGMPVEPQIATLADQVPMSSDEWQTAQLVVNPPSLSILAAALLAELHGRMGYFPTLLRLRPETDAVPPRYEVAELVSLQSVRDRARVRRQRA